MDEGRSDVVETGPGFQEQVCKTMQWHLEIASIAGTEHLAREIAAMLRPGDLVTLGGGLGVGKTTFARALIRSVCADPALEVPSPTYTLIQTYDSPLAPLVHADLYRINDPEELDSLGWNETSADAIVLVEWADRIGAPLPPDRLDVTLSLGSAPDTRRVVITAHGAQAQRLAMTRAIHEVIEHGGFAGAERLHLQGDASTRAYERLIRPSDGRSAILMIAPRRPDGPPVRNGKPYSQIAKLAEDVKPFVALAHGLRSHGFSAPAIYASDLDAGLLLIEDLGSEGVLADGVPVEERYMEAAAALAHLHALTLPHQLPVAGGIAHAIPRYDLEALSMETELLLDWYLPHMGQTTLPITARVAFADIWSRLLGPVLAAPVTWTLRDYHSPNLIWLAERQGVQRVGIIDFQDCVLGPPAYDVVSLTQDARVDVPAEMELRLLGHYVRLRRTIDPAFDAADFARTYAIMGAQRATKILGIFARLNKRDGKPGYLKHLPRIERNVRRCLAHPALAELKQWYETMIPDLFATGEPEA